MSINHMEKSSRSMMARATHSSTQEAEGWTSLRVQGRPGLDTETAQNINTIMKKMHLGMMVHACNPGNWDAEAGGSPWVTANLGYTVSPRSGRGPARGAARPGWAVCVQIKTT